jgi:hypothetical protein
MEQIVIDIQNAEDAALIKSLLKRFKNVDVASFTPAVSKTQMAKRIEKGLKDADEGKVKPWKTVKASLLKKIQSKG